MKINEAQLRPIIAKQARQCLKEYYDLDFELNPGGAKNGKVANLGSEALETERGKTGESDFDNFLKHTGGAKNQFKGVNFYFHDGIYGKRDAQEKFFKAMANDRGFADYLSCAIQDYREDSRRMKRK